MKLTTTPPTSGQFIAVWEYNDLIWSDTFRFNKDGELEKYLNEIQIDGENFGDDWERANLPKASRQINLQFITL